MTPVFLPASPMTHLAGDGAGAAYRGPAPLQLSQQFSKLPLQLRHMLLQFVRRALFSRYRRR